MRKFKQQCLALAVLGFAILLSLSMEGCSLNGDSTKDGPENVTVTFLPGVPEGDTTTDEGLDEDIEEDIEEDIKIDTSVSSGHYLSLGVLDEDIVLNGAGRDKPEVTVAGGKVLFPQGGIRSICIRSWARKEKAYDLPKEEIVQYVDALERAGMVDGLPENVWKMVRIETHILYVNSDGEFRTIGAVSFGNGYFEIFVEKDDAENFAKEVSMKSDTGEKYQHIFVRSMEAEKAIKGWIQWESQGEKGFGQIQSASWLADENADGIKLTESQLKKLKAYLKADRQPAEAPCGYECYFECIQDDGSKFHFSISADGETISTDKSVYRVDHPENEQVVELFEEFWGR